MFRPRHARSGITLLEVLIVAVLLALAAAVVAPALRAPRPPAGMDDATARARRAAVRRGEALELRVGADGAWTVVAADAAGAPAAADAPVLLAGRLDERPAAERRLRLTPLGLCLPAGGDAEAGAARWDPVRCAPVREDGW